MNVDRLPDSPEDPRRDAGTRLTDSPDPRNAPPPKLEREHHPTPDHDPRTEPEPELEQEPQRDHPPKSPQTESPTHDNPDPAEPRTRQEHANPPETREQPDQTRQEEIGTVGEQPSARRENVDRRFSANDREDGRTEKCPGLAEEHKGPSEPAEWDQQADYEFPTESRGNAARTSVESTRPLTNQEHAEHESEVFDLLVKAHDEDLSTDYAHTTDPDRQQWTPQRDALHGQIVQELYGRASEVPCEYMALIVGGLGGAGKTTILNQSEGIDPASYLVINPDVIKEELAERGLVPEIEGLSPMEASDLVHEESSAIAKQLARKAQSEGRNLIWDITMASEESTQKRIDDLRAAGYTQVDGLFVDIPIETSIRRMELRHREGHDNYRAGIGLGGRYVPPEVIRRQEDPDFSSKNKKTFEIMKKSLNNWEVHDNGTDGRPARLVGSNRRAYREDQEG